MTELQILEQRWKELLGRPRTKEEIVESSIIRKRLEDMYRDEISELNAELKAVTEFDDVWDLVNTKIPYPDAIDILLKHLPKDYHDKNKEGIVRALTVKEAKGKAAAALIKEYEKTPKEKDNLRWIIGNAIATTMTPEDVDWVLSTVTDKSNMGSRAQLVVALGIIKTDKSEAVLINLLEDESVLPQAIFALGSLKSKKAKEKILKFKESTDSLIRSESQKALKKLG